MSLQQAVANFYVDRDGKEQPMRYLAKDLINVLAPEGYHWEEDTKEFYAELERWVKYVPNPDDRRIYHPPAPKYPDPVYYIAVLNKES